MEVFTRAAAALVDQLKNDANIQAWPVYDAPRAPDIRRRVKVRSTQVRTLDFNQQCAAHDRRTGSGSEFERELIRGRTDEVGSGLRLGGSRLVPVRLDLLLQQAISNSKLRRRPAKAGGVAHH